uniref:Uncharacterized protein n=2 Tax=Kalanchoe fedtschenkoi TaxID=63787 RepID=A0A7N0TEK4_KALFE
MEWRGSGLKRTISDEAMSSMAGYADACNQISTAKFQEQSMVWTNEKHNLYIESLETSFVQQLHQSLGFHANTHDSFDKFTAVQDGCRKVSKSKSKSKITGTANGRKNVSHPEQLSVSYNSYHLSSSYDEFSDQNFIDEQEVTYPNANEWQRK